MDLSWLTFTILPFGIVFALVFSLGILIFIFYELVDNAEQRKREAANIQTVASDGDGKALNTIDSTSGLRKRIKIFGSFKLRRKVAGVKPDLGKTGNKRSVDFGTGPPINDDSMTRSDIKPPGTEDRRYDAQTVKLEARPVSDLSEVMKTLSKKGEMEAEVRADAPKPPDQISKTDEKGKTEKDIPGPSTQTPPLDTDDVSVLLGRPSHASNDRTAEAKETQLNAVIQVQGQPHVQTPDSKMQDHKVKQDEDAQGNSEKPRDQEPSSVKEENTGRPPQIKERQKISGDGLEVEALLKSEEPSDVVKIIPEQFAELRSSLDQLKTTLKRLSEKNANESKE